MKGDAHDPSKEDIYPERYPMLLVQSIPHG